MLFPIPVKSKKNSYPLLKASAKIQRSLFLIREELKTRKFFDSFHQLGLADCYFRAHLDSLIKQCLGMHDDTDEAHIIYEEIMQRCSKKINANMESINGQTLRAYKELMEVKTRIKK